MATIEERVVKMRFDNSQFASKVKDTIDAVKRLEEKLKFKNNQDLFKGINYSASKVNFSPIEDGVGKVNTKLSAMGVIANGVLSQIGYKIADVGITITKKLLSPLETIWSGGKARAFNIEEAKFKLEGLGIVGEKLALVWQNVTDAVDGTAYSLDAAALTAAQLAASGIEGGKQMETALKSISGVAAVTSSSYEDIGRIFTQIAGQGKVMSNDLMQLSSRGMNAAATLAKELGKTEAEVREMVTKGKIDFDTFATAMYNAFSEAAFKANETVNGVTSNIRSAFSKIGADLITPFITNVGTEGHVSNLVELLNKVRESINLVRASLKPLFDSIQWYGLKVIQGLTNFLDKFNILTTKSTKSTKEQAKATKEAGEEAKKAAKEIEEMARTVIRGDWGNGAERVERLTKAGHDFAAIQKVVNEMIWGTYKGAEAASGATSMAIEKLEELAQTVIRGDWGNGQERFDRLTAAGYDYAEVQGIVNEMVWGTYDRANHTAKAVDELADATEKAGDAAEKAGPKYVNFRDSLAKAGANLVKAVMRPLRGIGDAIANVFHIEDVAQFVNLTSYYFEKLTSKLVISHETRKKITEVFTKLFQGIRTGFDKTFPFIQTTIKKVNELFDAIWKFKKIPIDIITEPFKAIGRFFNLFKGNEKFQNGLSNIGKSFANFGEIFKAIGSGLSSFKQGFENVLGPIFTNIGKFFSNLRDNFEKNFVNVVSAVFKFFSDILLGASTCSLDFVNKTKEKFSEWGSVVGGIFGKVVNGAIRPAIDWFGQLFGRIGTVFGNAKKIISDFVAKVGPKLIGFCKKFVTPIKTYFGQAGKHISQWASDSKKTITKWIDQTLPGLKDWAKSAWEHIKEWVGLSGKYIDEWAIDAGSNIIKFTKKALKSFSEFYSGFKTKFLEVFKNVGPLVQDFVGGFSNYIGQGINRVKELFKEKDLLNPAKWIEKIKNFDWKKFISDSFENIKNFNFIEFFKGIWKSVDEAITKAYAAIFGSTDKTIFQRMGEYFGSVKDWFKKLIPENVIVTIQGDFHTIQNAFGTLATAFNDFIKSVSWEKVKSILSDILKLCLMISSIRMTWNIGGAVKSFSKDIGNALKAFSGIDMELETPFGVKWTQQHKKTGLENFTAFIEQLGEAAIKIAACMGLLSLLKPEEINQGLKTLGIIAGGIVGLGFLFSDNKIVSKLLGSMTGLSEMGDTFESITDMLFKLAVGLLFIGKLMNAEEIGRGLTGIGGVLGEVLVFLGLLNKFKGNKLPELSTAFEDIGKGMMMLTVPIAVLGLLPWDNLWRGLTITGLAMAGLCGAVVLLSKCCGTAEMEHVGSSLKGIGAALMMVMVPILVFSFIPWPMLLQGICVTAGALIGLSAAMVLIGNCSGSFKDVGKSMLLMATSLTLLMVPIIVFSKMKIDDIVQGMVSVGAALIVLGGALALISQLAGGQMVIGAASLVGLSISLMMLAGVIKILQGVEWEYIRNGITVFGVALLGLAGLGFICQFLSGGLLALGGTCLMIGGAAALAAAAVWLIVDSIQKAGDIAPGAATNFVNVVEEFGHALAQKASNIGHDFAQALGAGLVGALGGVLTGICQGLGNLFSDIGKFCGPIIDDVGKNICNWWKSIGGDIPEAMGEGAEENAEALKDKVNGTAETASVDPKVGNENGAKLMKDTADGYGQEAKNTDLNEPTQEAVESEEGSTNGGLFNGENAMDALKKAMQDADMPPDLIESCIEQIDTDNMGKLLGDGLLGGLFDNINGDSGLGKVASNLDFSALTSAFSNQGGEVMNVFGTAMGQSTAVSDGAQQAVDQLPEILASKDQVIQATAEATMTLYGESLVSGFNTNATPKISDVFLFVTQEFEKHAPDLEASGNAGTVSWATGFQAGYEANIIPVFKNLSEQVDITFDDLVHQRFEENGYESGTNYENGLDRASTLLTDKGTEMANSVISGFDAVKDNFGLKGEEVGTNLGTGIQNGINGTREVIQGAVDGIINFLSTMADKFQEVGKNAGEYYTTGMKLNIEIGMASVRSTMMDTMQKLIDEINQKILGNDYKYKDSATSNMRAYNQGMSAYGSQLKSTGSSISSGVAGRFSRYSDFYNAGSSCMVGFKNGMNSQAGSVWTTAYNLGRSALLAAKAAVNSNSPSKEFHKLGVFNDEGLILGMKSKQKDVEKTSAKVSRSALEAMLDVLDNVDLNNLDENLSPTITPVVDLSEINSARDRIDGLLSLNPESSVDLSRYAATAEQMMLGELRSMSSRLEQIGSKESGSVNNVFNINVTGANNPRETADEVSRRIQHQIERKKLAWA